MIISGKIRALQLIHNSALTGPGQVVYGLAKYLNQKEFAVEVLCPKDGYLSDELNKIGIKVIDLAPRFFWDFKSSLRLYLFLKKRRYHIFHLHSGQLNAFAKIMAGLLGIPALVVTEHLCAEEHTWIKNRFRLFMHLALHKISNRMVKLVIAVSEVVRDSHLKRQGLAPGKIVTIYNGVDTEELKPANSNDLEKGIPLVGMVARFFPEKGQRIFILAAEKVLQKIQGVKFILVGEGPQRQEMENLIVKLGLQDNFILTGFREDARKIIGTMDILVQPAFKEPFGLTVVEAMAQAKAVIASDSGACREIIKDNDNGLLFCPGDYFQLAEKICLVLSDAGLKRRLGKAARETAESRFEARMNAEKTGILYKELLLLRKICPQGDYLERVITSFSVYLKNERGFAPEAITASRGILEKYIALAGDNKLEYAQAQEYLNEENNFLIEVFLQFLEKNKFLDIGVWRLNNRLFKKALGEKKITSRDYDERIRMQPLKHQLDNFYQPQSHVAQARIGIILSLLEPKKGERILDLGCGVGTFSYHCAKKGAKTIGLDYSQESIRIAKELAEKFGLAQNTEFVCCDACNKLPYADGFFDKIVAADFIEHLGPCQKDAVFSEMARVLQSQGRIVIWTPNGIREYLASLKNNLLRASGRYAPETRLHYGLTNRFKLEKMMRKHGLIPERKFFDSERPYLARLPFLKEALSLNILWAVKKAV